MVNQSPINIVFLDVDGVLLSEASGSDNLEAYEEHLEFVKEKLGSKHEGLDIYDIGAVLRFNPFAINNLKKLCNNYDAKIVISSKWRLYNNMDQLTALFKLWGLDGLIIDVTPTTHTSIGHDIQEWFNTTGCKVASYVILDDVDDNLSELFDEKFVNTEDTLFFSSEHYEKATQIFEKNRVSTLEM